MVNPICAFYSAYKKILGDSTKISEGDKAKNGWGWASHFSSPLSPSALWKPCNNMESWTIDLTTDGVARAVSSSASAASSSNSRRNRLAEILSTPGVLGMFFSVNPPRGAAPFNANNYATSHAFLYKWDAWRSDPGQGLLHVRELVPLLCVSKAVRDAVIGDHWTVQQKKNFYLRHVQQPMMMYLDLPPTHVFSKNHKAEELVVRAVLADNVPKILEEVLRLFEAANPVNDYTAKAFGIQRAEREVPVTIICGQDGCLFIDGGVSSIERAIWSDFKWRLASLSLDGLINLVSPITGQRIFPGLRDQVEDNEAQYYLQGACFLWFENTTHKDELTPLTCLLEEDAHHVSFFKRMGQAIPECKYVGERTFTLGDLFRQVWEINYVLPGQWEDTCFNASLQGSERQQIGKQVVPMGRNRSLTVLKCLEKRRYLYARMNHKYGMAIPNGATGLKNPKRRVMGQPYRSVLELPKTDQDILKNRKKLQSRWDRALYKRVKARADKGFKAAPKGKRKIKTASSSEHKTTKKRKAEIDTEEELQVEDDSVTEPDDDDPDWNDPDWEPDN
jgi:hypothetical protein